MSESYTSHKAGRRGFLGSVELALKIAVGGLRLLWHYPKLVLPLVPVYVILILALFSLLFIQDQFLGLLVVFVVGYALMFSFAITSYQLRQLEEGAKPSILAAVSSPNTMRMIPRILTLSAVWYLLVMILVSIETALRALLGRISDDLADAVLNFVFGTVADAVRMAGFMLVAIMTFEGVGLRPAVDRLRTVASGNAVVILGGLALTKLLSLVALLVVMFLPEWTIYFILIPVGMVWFLGMYIEQIFVTTLYLYACRPQSRLVEIVLKDFVGNELPEFPPKPTEQPAV